MKILIAEDNRDDRKVLRYTVEKHGHTAIEAENGLDALKIARGSPPDLIISDGLMPQMDGFQFLWELKQEPKLKDIPFVFYSASYKGGEDIRLAKSMGANDYLIKPLDPTELWTKITRHLNAELSVPVVSVELAEEDAHVLKQYSRMVATKLEKKVHQLEKSLEERRRVEEALRESQRFVRNILDTVDEGFIVVDSDYRIISANRAFCDMAKSSEEHVKGRLCHENIFHSLRPCFESKEDCPVRRAFESGTSHKTMHTYTDKTGEKHYFEIKTYPIIDSENTVTSVIETINNVTEKRKLEAQLQQAQKMESIGRLAGGVAHDFNNMLGVILGYSDMALKKLSPDQPQFSLALQQIHHAAEHSVDLTRQLLAFARKQAVAPKVLDINQVLTGMLKMLRRLIGEDINLVWLPGEEQVLVRIDPSQLNQILANLVVNARDAISENGKLIIETDFVVLDADYCTEHLDAVPGDFLRLSISDNGCGMTAEIREKIFEPFFTTKKEGEGTGLGLSMVYGIVKQNEGFINVYSEPGLGTTFRIYLPQVKADIEQQLVRSQALPLAREHETILLTEDEEIYLDMSRKILESLGYQVLTAAKPSEAIRIAKEYDGEIHLLFTDLIMPEMNGMDLMKNLTELRPGLKYLIMSGYSDKTVILKGLLSEKDHFISKPFSVESLADMIRKLLDGK